jgi:hypothetical protein
LDLKKTEHFYDLPLSEEIDSTQAY